MINHYDKYNRNPKATAFYRSADWKKTREYVFNRDMGLCQSCLDKGEIVTGDVVHHIHELLDGDKGWELRLDPSNLILICHSCHNNIHKGKEDDLVRDDVMFDSEGRLIRKE